MGVNILDRGLERLDDVLDRCRGKRLKDGATAAFLVGPAVIILGAFGIAPLISAVVMSLYDLKLGMGDYAGLANYYKALHHPEFWRSFFVTVYYAVGTIPTTMVLSFLVASGLFRLARAQGLFRTVYFLPYVTSAVAAAMVWRALLNPEKGVANALLRWADLPVQRWLLEPKGILAILSDGHIPDNVGPSLALCCVMLFDIWHSSGFMIVIFLAGLSAIPRELEESAVIDGANAYHVIRHVRIPLLSPTIFFLLIVSVIRSFQAFNSFYALTGDGHGPLDTTRNMTLYIYQSFYENGRWGYGTAVATLLCLAIVTLTIIQWKVVGRKVHYE